MIESVERSALEEPPKNKGFYYVRCCHGIHPVWFDGKSVWEPGGDENREFPPTDYEWFGPVPSVLEVAT